MAELREMAAKGFGDMVKAVVDVEKGIMAVDGELHADEEALLMENGSKQKDLWGINIFPENTQNDLIEFDSMINLRPSAGNRTRSVESQELRAKIRTITEKLIKL